MDTVVCLDCSSSMASDLESIRSSIRAILGKTLVCHEGDVRMALIGFQSHSDHWITKVYPFTSSIDIFQQQINVVQTEGSITDEDKAIGKIDGKKQSEDVITNVFVFYSSRCT